MSSYVADLAGKEFRIEVTDRGAGVYRVRVGEESYEVDVRETGADIYSLIIDHRSYRADVEPVENDTCVIKTGGARFDISLVGARQKKRTGPPAGVHGRHQVNSPMTGNIWKVLRHEGEVVKAGEVLVILEAMKMENEICSPADGVVISVTAIEGAAVKAGSPLCIVISQEG